MSFTYIAAGFAVGLLVKLRFCRRPSVHAHPCCAVAAEAPTHAASKAPCSCVAIFAAAAGVGTLAIVHPLKLSALSGFCCVWASIR